VLKKLALLAVIVYSSVLVYVSLVKLENVPDIGVDYGDKIFHFLAYCMLTFLWFSAFIYNFEIKRNKAIIYSAIFSFTFGIIIEVLQHTMTSYRSLDVFDIIANTSGVIIVVLLLILKKNIGVKKI
jgi:VanZ family protein